MTSTIDQPRTVTVEPGETTGHQNRALKVGLLVLAVIAVALGGILIYNAAAGDDDTAAAIPDEIQQVLDDYFAASTDKDFEALLAVTTDEFTRPMYESSFEYSAARPAVFREVSTFDDLERNFARTGSYELTNVGDPLIHGDGPWFVSVAQIWETTTADGETGSGVGIQSIYTLVIVDDDGTLKVDDAYWAGHGLVPIED